MLELNKWYLSYSVTVLVEPVSYMIEDLTLELSAPLLLNLLNKLRKRDKIKLLHFCNAFN